MTDDSKALGRLGEKTALSFLKNKGFTILETNYKTKVGEIDIIAKDKDTLCFIEVKTRQSLKKGLPKEAITYPKQKKIILCASFYLKEKDQMNSRMRFDVVEVYKKPGCFECNLIENAFGAG